MVSAEEPSRSRLSSPPPTCVPLLPQSSYELTIWWHAPHSSGNCSSSSAGLCTLTNDLLVWAQNNLRSLKVTHVPGKMNHGADMLLRNNASSGEWTLFNFSICSSVGFSVCCGSKELIFGVSPRLLRFLEVEVIPESRHPAPAGTRGASPAHPMPRISAYLSNSSPHLPNSKDPPKSTLVPSSSLSSPLVTSSSPLVPSSSALPERP